MDKETLEALKKSIEYWEDNLAFAMARKYKNIDTTSESCALCEMFVYIDCCGCPVFDKVGILGCRSTPYGKVSSILNNAAFFGLGYAGITKACRKELEFLKSLLPENEKDQ